MSYTLFAMHMVTPHQSFTSPPSPPPYYHKTLSPPSQVISYKGIIF